MSLPPGIRRHGAGWQARVSVAGVGRSVEQFALATPFETMIEWQEDERYALQKEARQQTPLARATRGTFAHDAQRYLDAVAAMIDIKRRTNDILLWVVEFGSRRRSKITAAEIRVVRDRWLTVGPKRVYRKATKDRPAFWEAVAIPLSGSTVNHRLRALSNLWSVLDGRRAQNPVREVPEADEAPELPRDLPYDIIDRLLAAMPDRGSAARFEKRPVISKTKLRLRAMMWTGLAHKQLSLLRREHVDFAAATWVTTARKKGRGVDPERLPLLPQAVDALTAFFAAGADGSFSSSSMRASFLRAVRKVSPQLTAEGYGATPLKGVRPYDLRHSFGSQLFRLTGNLGTVGEFLQQADPRTSRRYALAAVNPVLTAALERWPHTPVAGPAAGPARSEESGISVENRGAKGSAVEQGELVKTS